MDGLFMIVASPGLHDPMRFFDKNVIVVSKTSDGGHRGATLNRERVGRPDLGQCVSFLMAGPQDPYNPKCLLSVVDGEVFYDLWEEELVSPSKRSPVSEERGDVLYICFGDSGWGPGQLEREIADGLWYKKDIDASVISDSDWETMWDRQVTLLGGNPADYGPESGDKGFMTIEVIGP